MTTEAEFTRSSQRVFRAAILAQIAEAQIAGMGEIIWISQLQACADRIEAALGGDVHLDPRAVPAFGW